MEESFDILFVFYDAGETLAHLPVLDAIDRDGLDISYRVVSMQTSATLTAGRRFVTTFDELGIRFPPDPPRSHRISSDAVQTVLERFNPRRAVVVGMVSATQRQLAEAYRQRGLKVVGYYDHFGLWDPTAVFATLLPAVDVVALTAESVKAGLLSDPNAAHLERVVVVGNPSTAAWSKAAAIEPDPQALRRELVGDDGRPILLYVSGYGDGYEESFSMFAEAAAVLASGYNILVALHPKVDGSLERALLEKHGASSSVHILPKTFKTMQVAAVCHVIATQRSTVSVQALYMGRPTVLLDVAGTTFTNVAVAAGLSPQVTSPAAFVDAVAAVRRAGFRFDPARLDSVGVPSDPVAAMVAFLRTLWS